MRIFDRYLFQKMLLSTLVGVIFMSFLALSSQVLREAKTLFSPDMEGMTLLLQFLVHTLPYMLVYMLPWAFLTSALITVKSLSGHNEIIAMRMTGASYLKLARPIIALGILCSAMLYFCAGYWTPTSRAKIKTLMSSSQLESGNIQLTPALLNSLLGKEFLVNLDSVSGNKITNLHLYRIDKETERPVSYTFAREAFLDFSDPEQVAITLDNVYTETYKDEGAAHTLYTEQISPLVIPIKKKRPSVRSKYLANPVLFSKIKEEPQTPEQEKRRLDYFADYISRLSMALSCFSFSLLALPLGLQNNRKVNNNGILWGIITAALFFGLLMGLEKTGDTMVTRGLAIMSPNLLAWAIAIWRFQRLKFS